ncbi:hypothetical protein [Actinomadura hibisca]|uniref:hypothetical protein n=1 Tax=Actinomadura hibisca TaxID=68565 RepID=UPI00082A4AB5|nr:hypothetical protein [Actinomadura hibisca]
MSGTGGVRNEAGGRVRTLLQAGRVDTVVNNYGGALDRERAALHAIPPNISDFTDRVPERALIDAAFGAPRATGQPAVVVLSGLAGTGRRAVAVRWAHERADGFPDGRLYLDFAGSGRDTAAPADLLAELLRQTGLPDEDVPASYAARHALWRDRTAGRRMLVVLANVRMAAQIEQVLPPSREAAVLVTTDHDLPAGRYGATRVAVRPLDPDAAEEFLTRLVGGDRIAAERAAADALLELCDGWPEALQLAGAWLRKRPGREVAAAVRRLLAAEHQDNGGEWQVKAVSDAAYEALPEPARRAYRLLGLHPSSGDRPGRAAAGPGVSFVLPAAAALLDEDEDTTADLLETLIDWELLSEENGRYLLRDRVRRHAHRQAQRLPEAEREQAVRRTVEWYLLASAAADLAVNPYRETFGAVYRVTRPAFGTGSEAKKRALSWLAIEHRNVCACVYAAADRGWNDLVVQLCEAQWGLQLSTRPYETLTPVLERGLAAAQALDDPRWVFRLGTQLGRARFETGRFAEAQEPLRAAREAAKDRPLDLATALEFTGRAHLDAGEYAEARPYFEQARELEERHDRPRGVAINLHHIARAYLGLGDADAAVTACREAHERFGQVRDRDGEPRPDRYNQGRVSTTLGKALLEAGRRDAGTQALLRALEIMRGEGRAYQAAQILEALSVAVPEQRDAYREQAIQAYDSVRSIQADRLRAEG